MSISDKLKKARETLKSNAVLATAAVTLAGPVSAQAQTKAQDKDSPKTSQVVSANDMRGFLDNFDKFINDNNPTIENLAGTNALTVISDDIRYTKMVYPDNKSHPVGDYLIEDRKNGDTYSINKITGNVDWLGYVADENGEKTVSKRTLSDEEKRQFVDLHEKRINNKRTSMAMMAMVSSKGSEMK